MIKRLTSACLLAAAYSLFMPAPAQAGIWRYIEELSGPGPFKGGSMEFRAYCWDPRTIIGDKPISAYDRRHTQQAGGKAQSLGAVLTLKIACVNKIPANSYQRFSLNVEAGYLFAKASNNPIVSEDGERRRVYLIPVEAIVYFQPTLGVELGTGGGVFVFFKKQLYAYTTPMLVLEPFRVDVRPFDLWWSKRTDRMSPLARTLRGITVRQSLLYFPNRMTADDFGGGPDNTFNVRNDIVKSFEIAFDLAPFFRKLD